MLVLVLSIGWPAGAQQVSQVTALRFGTRGERTRVVLEADRRLPYSTKAQSEPGG